jgi:hypothetical protein
MSHCRRYSAALSTLGVLVLVDIFQEIDEELRQDRLNKLWKSYGYYFVGFLAFIIVCVGGWKGWQMYSVSQLELSSHRYEVASRFLLEEKQVDASSLFQGLYKDGYAVYKVLGAFERAALLAKNEKANEALELYSIISKDPKISQAFRDAGSLFSVLLRMKSPSARIEELLVELTELRKEGRPWRFSALELIGLLELRSGNVKAAESALKSLADDTEAPQSLRARAAQILSTVGQS